MGYVWVFFPSSLRASRGSLLAHERRKGGKEGSSVAFFLSPQAQRSRREEEEDDVFVNQVVSQATAFPRQIGGPSGMV